MVVTRESLTPVNFGELRIFDYTSDKKLSSSLASIEVPPGAEHPETWSRRSDKYYFVATGIIVFAIEGHRHELRSGDFCFVGRGKRFMYRNESPQPAKLVLMHTPMFNIEDEVFVG